MSLQQHEQDFGEVSRLPKIGDRRREQRSGSTQQSSRAVSLEIAIIENLALEQQLEFLTTGITPKQSLCRLLSIKSVVSTSSSFAERQRAAIGTEAPFREIGTGSIDVSKLWNNYVMNRRIENRFEELGPEAGQVEVPHAIWYASDTTNEFWDANIDRFLYTNEFRRQRRHVLCFERIFPLPKPTRDCLIDMYCPKDGRESAKSYVANKDCLLRPLLGRKRQSTGSKLNSFSLRNFKLHLDQIAEIGFDAQELAFAMADALAVLHWHTRIDAMDVEFVLGSSPQEDQRVRRSIPLKTIMGSDVPKSTFEHVTNFDANFSRRVTTLWLLDFDACSDITMDQAGVDMACKAFVETDPYFPRPHSSDDFAQKLWNRFDERYIGTAGRILTQGSQDLPAQLLAAVSKALSPHPAPRPLSATIAHRSARGQGQYSRTDDGSRGRASSTGRPNITVSQGSFGSSRNLGVGGPSSVGSDRRRQSRASDDGLGGQRTERGGFYSGGSHRRGRGRGFHASEGESRRMNDPWHG